MTGGGVNLDRQSLNGAGEALAVTFDGLGQGLDQLASTLARLGNPWGSTDEIAGAFGAAYMRTRNHAIAAIGTYQDQVGYAADTLIDTAEDLPAVEGGNADTLAARWRTLKN